MDLQASIEQKLQNKSHTNHNVKPDRGRGRGSYRGNYRGQYPSRGGRGSNRPQYNPPSHPSSYPPGGQQNNYQGGPPSGYPPSGYQSNRTRDYCDYCGKGGHIPKNCFKAMDDWKQLSATLGANPSKDGPSNVNSHQRGNPPFH